MKELLFTKVFDSQRRRAYKLSEPITKAPRKQFDWETEREYALTKRVKEQFRGAVKQSFECIIISDAHTHIERLAFAGFEFEPGEYGILSMLHMDGALTFLSHGGDPDSVYPDEVYLRRIASANGFRAVFETAAAI